MNIFKRIVAKEHETDTRLGMPLYDVAHKRRLDAMSRMTGGNGFPTPAKDPRKDAQGRTRGERKRALRAATMAKVSEDRAPQFMHSAARRRGGYEYDWRTNSYAVRAVA